MSEKDFALKVLQISASSYSGVKNNRYKTIILKYDINQEELERIKGHLLQEGYINKLIDYAELQRLHRCFGNNMSEKDFALKVLQISYSSYFHVKNRGTKTIILKYNTSQEEIEKIKEQLLQEGYANKLIDYLELQQLHQNFGKYMSEKDFAFKILELSYDGYYYIKKNGAKSTILKSESFPLIKDILLKESRYYKKEEIITICKQNNLTIDQFIESIVLKHNNNIRLKEYYKQAIDQGKLWIGKTNLSNDFINKNLNKIYSFAKKAIIILKSQYKIDFNCNDEDEIHDAILYVIQNRGDIEKNFKENDEIIDFLLYSSIKKYLYYKILKDHHITIRTLSLNKKYRGKFAHDDNKELQEKITTGKSTESEVFQSIQIKKANVNETDLSEKCIQELKRQLEQGKSKKEALYNTSKKLHIEEEEMLQLMQTYLITNKKIYQAGRNFLWNYNDEERS